MPLEIKIMLLYVVLYWERYTICGMIFGLFGIILGREIITIIIIIYEMMR